ncbi:MAG: pyruvate-flavodoxin oxidoreductase [Cellulomonas sp. 73-92]|uniref:2-oxoacid:acceptor oxidoreductase family protein n=1 Tax=Cellulomonas sp. 73-92 TaxID=1895740 RepID=UPI0009268578|nr:2-oxoacid:acceptor oxidoreductase family protein [Cellulomonas sp. 73-92]OJV81051.1 MAG: pyruvate-flavodoxin oxidoreductase [Cellulomonas sp. 73-92]
MTADQPKYPGLPDVINGNGAVAHVMKHVCGGVIGYPITPSTEIVETFEAARAEGQLNVWGKHAFFVEAEGEHSAQSGALGAALTGGNFISNASSSQGILYALESHYVTVGKKIGGFVLQVAARVVSKHSLNVMAGHDDIYSLLPAGYTVLFGSNPQEASDLAAIAYRTSSLSLIPVANTFDGFATSHVMSEVLLPEPELLKEYLGDPAGRIASPTVAQEILFGAKGRVFQLGQYLDRHAADFAPDDLAALRAQLAAKADAIEADDEGALVAETTTWVPEDLRAQWRRAWVNAWAKGTRQLVPALVDPHNPGLTGPVQNQPDFQAGAVDHRTHFVSAVPGLARQAMAEYAELTGREYKPVMAYGCEDADYVMVGLGSITDDVRAVLPYLRSQGLKVGVVSVKILQPFPEAELVEALKTAKAVTVLERSDDTALTRLVTQSLFRARANASNPGEFPGIPALATSPRLTTAIYGLGGHDVQPRHMVAAFKNMVSPTGAPLVYIGSQFFSDAASGELAAVQDRLRAAYPETELMALTTEANPQVLPDEALRIRFHSVGGYGTIATGKLLTDILAGVLGMYSKSAPKYGSEKSGAATNFYITLSPEPVLLTNAELEDVEVVISPDHKAFIHTNPLKGLAVGGTFIMQSDLEPIDVWRSLPAHARRTIREKHITFLVMDAFRVAKVHAPKPELETRMMGIAFIGAVVGYVDRVSKGASRDAILEKVRHELTKKFGRKGDAIVNSNMAVITDAIAAITPIDYEADEFVAVDAEPAAVRTRTVALSASMCPVAAEPRATALFDPAYYEDLAARPFREGTIGESPVLPGAGLFMPVGTGVNKDKGIFRRSVPVFDPTACTGCLECGIACPDAAIPNTLHEIHDLVLTAIGQVDAPEPQREALRAVAYTWSERIRQEFRADADATSLAAVAATAVPDTDERALARYADAVVAQLAAFPVARTRPFFDAMEKQTPGTGALFSAVVDPWKCTGCLQCVDVCGPHALTAAEQDDNLLDMLEQRFETMAALPNTPKRFVADAVTPEGDVKRMVLDHANYYAMTGGHGACRGCGEVTAVRLMTAMSKALGEERKRSHVAELEQAIAQLTAKLDTVEDAARRKHLGQLVVELDKALYLYEGGPTGTGPASTVIANSTGCSSVYASTMPFQPYLDPWVNSLFQDAQPLAVGIYEGLASQLVPEVRALRDAKLELADAYDPAVHGKAGATLTWHEFTPDELALLPNILTIGGDGASYDIGFGAMSRVLTSGTPIKALVLDTGGYSNTGGQASTASLTGQDADLARYGKAHAGKREVRKEMGVIAAFHPNVFVATTATALHGHFLGAAMSMLGYREGAALMEIYAPCGTENGIPEDLSNRRSRLAVESRVSPLFVHDPRQGSTLPERFNLDGNPDVDKLWTSSTLEYVDESGNLQLMQTPLTPAEFALGEVRFAKQFKKLKGADEATLVPIAEFVELSDEARVGKVPFVYATDDDKHLIKVACQPAIVTLVEDRKHHWQTLQYLAGFGEARLTAEHKAELADMTARYAAASTAREASLDEIAAAMAELAASSAAPASMPAFSFGGGAPAASAAPAPAAAATAVADRPIWLDPADEAKCNDCGTCYQELPALFEKATIVVDGQARVVGRMKAGALDGFEVTPEIAKRIARVKSTCDAEIIH